MLCPSYTRDLWKQTNAISYRIQEKFGFVNHFLSTDILLVIKVI